jgi:hypothetical protein
MKAIAGWQQYHMTLERLRRDLPSKNRVKAGVHMIERKYTISCIRMPSKISKVNNVYTKEVHLQRKVETLNVESEELL